MTDSERITTLARVVAELGILLANALKRIEELERKNN